jgi:hypothetical protein
VGGLTMLCEEVTRIKYKKENEKRREQERFALSINLLS